MNSLYRRTGGTISLYGVLSILVCCAIHAPVAESAVSTASEMKKIVVAKVNGTAIHRDELVKMKEVVKAKNPGAWSALSDEELGKAALDQLILRELAYQEAKRRGMTVDQNELNFAMNNIIKSKGYDKGFQEYLRKEQLTEQDVRAQIEKTLLLQHLFKEEVTEKVDVSDAEVRSEFDRQKERLIVPEKVSVLDVLIPGSPGDKVSLQKAKNIRATIMADKDKDPGKLEPDGSFAVIARDLVKENEPALYKAARKLSPRGISGVIKAGDGYHVIQLTGFTPQKKLTFEEAKSLLKERVLLPKQQQRTLEWTKELKKNAKIEIIGGGSGEGKAPDGKR